MDKIKDETLNKIEMAAEDIEIVEKGIEVNSEMENVDESIEMPKKRKRKRFRKLKDTKVCMRIMSFVVLSVFMFGATICKAGAVSVNNKKMVFNISDNGNTENKENQVIKEQSKEETKIENNKDNDKKESNGVSKEEKSENKYKNTSKEGQKYIYDALEVSKKLMKEDYSNNGKKIVFLTFDDGASNTVTPKILKVLDDYDVKATFFVMGQVLEDGGQNVKKLVKEEYDKGHAIGNHSYSHDYDILYPGKHLDLEGFKNDYNKNVQELKKILGEDFSTRVIRCPGGYMSWKGMDQLDDYLKENNMASIDWSALSGDAEGSKKDASQLLKKAVESSMNQEMVVLLMHDTYGKEETANSLPKIIEYFKGHGYEFRTLG